MRAGVMLARLRRERAGHERFRRASAPGISEAEALKLWNIVEIGLGGYVIGRSAEKTLPRIVEVLKR
jgi:hypothetical protein